MLTLHVEAYSYSRLVQEAQRALGLPLIGEAFPVAAITTDGEVKVEGAQPISEQTLAAKVPDAPAPTKGRGRPKKAEQAQPAVADNTGSAPAASPPAAEDATDAAAVQPEVKASAPAAAPPSSAMEPDKFRAALQEYLNKLGNDTNIITSVFAEFGATKWKQIDPSKYAECLAKIDAAVQAKAAA